MRKLLPLVALLFLVSTLHAQLTYLNATGSPTFNAPSPVEQGFINLSNGNLHLQVPFGTWPQRGAIAFSAGMVYDSRIWQIVNSKWQPTNVPNSMAGWRFATSVDAGTVTYMTGTSSCQGGSITTYSVFMWTAPDGTEHAFPITTSQNTCTNQNVTSGDAFASDSTGYHMYVSNYTSATVYAKNGNKVSPSSEDTNGNYFSADGNGNVIDTLGRTPVTKSTNGSVTDYNVLNSQGTTSQYAVTTETISVATSFGQSGVTEYSGNITAVESIGLPDGSSYSFGYDGYGEVDSVTLRTGGTITYGYTNFSDSYGNINRWVNSRVSAGGTWSYSPTVVTTCSQGGTGCTETNTVTKPSTDETVYTFTLNNGSWNTQIQAYTGSSTLLETTAVTFDFSNSCPFSGCIGAGYVRPTQINTTDPVPGSNIIKQTTFGYDSIYYGNVNVKKEWRYYTGSPSPTPDRETDTTYLTTSSYINVNIVDRPTNIVVKNGSGTQVANTQYSYDTTTLTSQTGDANHDDTNYGTSYTTRGNVTQILQWVSGSGCSPNTVACLTTSQSFSTEGNLLSKTDPNSNTTHYSYTDAFYTDNGQNTPPTYTPPTPTHAYLTEITYPNSQTFQYKFYFGSGHLAFDKNENGNQRFSHYIDPLDRITEYDNSPVNTGTSHGWQIWVYPTSSPYTQLDSYIGITSTDPGSSCTSCRHDVTTLDGNGRITRKTLASDPEGQTFTDTTYDTTGRIASVSNPYRTTSDPTYGIESYSYDGMDRETKNTHQDNNYTQTIYGAAVSGAGGAASQLCSTSTYGYGYPALKIDESGKMLQSWVDGFGRTIEADEPQASGSQTPAVGTCYSYDLLDDLTQVVQGSETRTYSYDGRARQTSATEPESGTTNTYYTTSAGALCDGVSTNACRITDARNVTTTYTYDSRDRLTGKSYSDSTHSVTYSYDQTSCNGLTITNGKNRRTCMTDASGTTAWSYDPAGHILTEKRTVTSVSPSVTKTISNTYNLDDSVATKTYPSTNVITYTYSNAQRMTELQNTATNVQYAQSITYAPHGQISGMLNGKNSSFGGITYSRGYNNRLQVTSTSATSSNGTALNLAYAYDQGGGINNGSLVTLTNNKDTTRSESFTYDNLNRVATGQTSTTSGSYCWGLNISYDRYGNMTSQSALSAFQSSCTNSTFKNNLFTLNVNTNNQIGGNTYDAAGNLTSDAMSGYNFTYDAENHMTKGNGVTYTTDGDDWRIEKSNGQLEWHDDTCDGALLDNFDLSGTLQAEFYYIGSMLFATRSFYYYGDHLQSQRAMTDDDGVVQWESDYLPFGAEVNVVNTSSNDRKFVSKKRDSETSLDHAHYRMLNYTEGRWESVDPKGGSLTTPQSLNRYPYVAANPVNRVDLQGLELPDDSCASDPVCAAAGGNAGYTLYANGIADPFGDSYWNPFFVSYNPTYVPPVGGGGGGRGGYRPPPKRNPPPKPKPQPSKANCDTQYQNCVNNAKHEYYKGVAWMAVAYGLPAGIAETGCAYGTAGLGLIECTDLVDAILGTPALTGVGLLKHDENNALAKCEKDKQECEKK